ncbi:RecB-like helicase [Nitrosophilus alvini]|uniref:RecB-like helicase n=1 Tax=Nitrosophilus alvini TaxID=2714855 RepID=UPI00190A0D2F|nr:RecB-like helicase [Nitrosophilus alvini]
MEKLLAYEASAGTGKTFALVVRYIGLLFSGALPDRILALTFTNKAANEMRERIAYTLKNLKDSAELEKISEDTGIAKEEILKKQPYIYKKFLKADLKIVTIDSFFAKVLRKFSSYASLLPDFSISSAEDRDEIIFLFLKYAYKQGKIDSLLRLALLEEKRLKDIFSLFVLLYESGEDFSFEFQKSDISFFKKEVLRYFNILKEAVFECEEIGVKLKNMLNEESIEKIAKKSWIAKESLKYSRSPFNKCYREEMDEYLLMIKKHLKRYFDAKEADFFLELFDLFLLFKEVNFLYKTKNNRVVFSDILNFSKTLLREKIENDFLYFRLDSKIDHLLIDEFQDTSLLQFRLLEPIVEEIASGEGRSGFRTFFYVGDVKQSIYRFRGGFKELFGYVAKRYCVRVVPMAQNFRSDRLIVEFVNEIFKPLYDKGRIGFVRQEAMSKKEGFVKVKQSDDLLRNMTKEIKALLDAGVDENDIAILCFKNDDCLAVEEKIKNELPGVSVLSESSMRLLHEERVRAVVEFLKYIYFKEEIYLKNFEASFGLEDISFDMESYERLKKRLPLLIKRILNDFNLFDGDENLLKLLEISTTYSTLGDFLFSLETIDESIVPSSAKGIKVLTVHKSKGLEFGHVLLMDRFGIKRGGGDPIIFDYDEIELKRVYKNMGGRENVDELYNLALQKENLLKAEDELNALYVAFTRPKHSLIVLKKEKNSVFDRLGLEEIQKGRLEVSVKSAEKKEHEKFEYEKEYYGPQNKKSDKDTKSKDFSSVLFGQALHYVLEMIDLNDIKTLGTAMEAAFNRYGGFLTSQSFEEIEKRVTMLLSNSDFLNLIKGEILKEQPLLFNGETKQIDLLVENSEGYTVIDYKSSYNERESHIKQVTEYVSAVSSITGNRCCGVIVYLLRDEILIEKI